jgi:hypothetical protein
VKKTVLSELISQGTMIIRGLGNMTTPTGTPILEINNNLQFLAIIFTLVAWVLFLLFPADIVSRFKLLYESVPEKTFTLAELHDVQSAKMIQNHLMSANIAFSLQGYYHRHLLYFFAPYILINLMIIM